MSVGYACTWGHLTRDLRTQLLSDPDQVLTERDGLSIASAIRRPDTLDSFVFRALDDHPDGLKLTSGFRDFVATKASPAAVCEVHQD